MLRYNTAVLRYNTGLLRYNKCPPSTAAPACGAAACAPAAVLSHPPRGLHDRNRSVQAPPCGVPILTDMQWDAQGNARPSPPPKTNAERQAEFRRLNPDYYRLYQARLRAATKAARLQRQEAERALIAKRQPLLLPAPAETIEIPGMTTIPTRSVQSTLPTPEPVPLHAQPTPPPPAAKPLAA
jgi:hypothetical protein